MLFTDPVPLEQYPKVTVNGAAQSDMPSSIYATTEQRNPRKRFVADVNKLDSPASLTKNSDSSKFKETVQDIVKTESKSGSSSGLDRNLGDKSEFPNKPNTAKSTPSKSNNTKEF